MKQFFPGYRLVINFRPSAQPLKKKKRQRKGEKEKKRNEERNIVGKRAEKKHQRVTRRKVKK